MCFNTCKVHYGWQNAKLFQQMQQQGIIPDDFTFV
jgi:hypothetical protein